MAGAKFQYDESGSTFYYFLLAFEALILIPLTYLYLRRDSGQNEHKREKSGCSCDHCQIKNSRLRAQEPWRKAKDRIIKVLLLIGWIALFLTWYKVKNLLHDYIAYDPYEILQIYQDAPVAEIKKAYRKLSLLYHPDKADGDEKKFMMIAKAYAALTDEEANKNWQLYGSPDGPGAYLYGIALPSFIIQEEYSHYVLGLYALVFMVALPVSVGIWWYRSVKFGTESVLLDTTQLFMFFIYKTPHMILKRVIYILAASMEFNKNYNNEIIQRASDNEEVPMLIKELPNLGVRNQEKPLSFPYSIKARALLFAHFSRMKLSKNLDEDRQLVLRNCPLLLQEFVQCVSQLTMLALAGRISRVPSLDTMENAIKLSCCVVQALWDKKNPLLQLPHITEDMLRYFTSGKRNVRSLKNLACMKSDERRAMLRTLNDEQYDDIIQVLSKMPIVEVEVISEVLDDEDSSTITAGSLVTLTASLHRRNMEVLFDKAKRPQEDFNDDMEYDEPTPELGGDVSPKPERKKMPDKRKKKKGRGTSQLQKKAYHSRNDKKAKAAKANNGILPAAAVKVEKVKKFKPPVLDESGGESEIEEEEAPSCNNSGSEDDATKTQDVDDDVEWEKCQLKLNKRDKKALEGKSKLSHTVHCPHFPDPKQEFWWVYVVDRKKSHALITAPFLVTNLVNTEEVELKFTAPPRPGIYSYAVCIRSDSYIDFDVTKTVKLDVKEAKVVDLSKLKWDISEEEEEKDEEESAVEDSDLATDDDELSDD